MGYLNVFTTKVNDLQQGNKKKKIKTSPNFVSEIKRI